MMRPHSIIALIFVSIASLIILPNISGTSSLAIAQTQVPVAVPPLAPAWWQNPQWWAILATALLGVVNFGLQFYFRVSDRRSEINGEHFDTEIRDPIRDAYKDLRQLAGEISRACDLTDATNRAKAIKDIRENSSTKAFSAFSFAVLEADRRLGLAGRLGDINAVMEDTFHPALGRIEGCQTQLEIRNCSRTVADAIIKAISDCDSLLLIERKKYIAKD